MQAEHQLRELEEEYSAARLRLLDILNATSAHSDSERLGTLQENVRRAFDRLDEARRTLAEVASDDSRRTLSEAA